MTPEEARAEQLAAWETLQQAIGDFFDKRLVADRLYHDAECTDPLCTEKEERDKWGPQSLSTFVLLAEYTTMRGDGTTGTRTAMAPHGSPMAVLGLITEALITWSG